MCIRNVTNVKEAIKALSAYITDERKLRIQSVVSKRIKSIAVLVEDVKDSGNLNAITRSMDAFGFQDIHQIKYPGTFLNKPSMRTDGGSRQWVTLHDWYDTEKCVTHLKSQGYAIGCTHLTARRTIQEVDFKRKLVLAFGNEARGVTDDLTRLSDFTFSIPMVGFVSSLNVSVCAAIALYHASMSLHGEEMVRKRGEGKLLSTLVCTAVIHGNNLSLIRQV